MKLKFVILCFIVSLPVLMSSQTNSEIAGVYIERSEKHFYDLEIDKALDIFNKALKYMDSVPNSRVAKLGTLLHFEHQKYFEARSYARSYFELEEDKSSEDYQTMLATFVDIQEEIESYIAEQKALELKRQAEDRAAQRLDSLNTLWLDKSKAFAVVADSIYQFNKYNLAVFSKNGQLGIIDDVGNIVEQPQAYKYVITYDGYILFLDKETNPTKIFVYNCVNRKGRLLPQVSILDSNATNYGKVMLPRANGLIVTYPNTTSKAFVYNIEEKLFSDIEDLKEFLKTLKKNDIIEKYKDEQVRINKTWLTLGSHLGAQIYELYDLDSQRFGYLNTANGRVWDVNTYNFLGGFYNGNFELIEDGKRFWADEEGLRRETNVNENGIYNGASRFVKNTDGTYAIIQNRNGKDFLVLGDAALLNQKHFVDEATK
ncbi:MAG: hypothetical protein AB8B52_07360 [Winogradskyella sp.]|uniref:hypothetical protein n=1 Tax=Winogradskyella sp. TaxID=1883156 RepID=UPI00385E6C69